MPLIKDWEDYLHDYKRKETDIVFKGFSGAMPAGRCLELGCGDGYQASLIKRYFRLLVSTEYNKNFFRKPENGVSYCVCDAMDMPFSGNSFDMIFSSNVMEHIKDREKSFDEIKRVMKDGGVIAHIVPSRSWKVLNCALLYPYIFLLLFNRKELNARVQEKKKSAGAGSARIFRYLFPRVHGEYKSHLKEFISYGEKRWRRLFENSGFKIKKMIKLPLLSSGYGFNFGRINNLMERAGFSSSYAFFMTIDKG